MSSVKAAIRSDPATIAYPKETALISRSTLLFALALFLGVLSVYVFTLSNNYSQDSMAFATLATQGHVTEPLFFQAEHLLWPFAGWLWYQLWVFFGYKQGALIPLQMLNATGGAAGVALFFLALTLLLDKSQTARLLNLFSAFVLAASYGYWYHSTEAEDQIIANALVIATFLLFVLQLKRRETNLYWYPLYTTKPDKPGGTAGRTLGSQALLVLTMGLAMLFHGTTVLFLPALLLGLWLKERDFRPVLTVFVGVVALVGLALVLVGGLAHGFRTPSEYLHWLLSAPSVGVWGHFSPRSLWIGVQTLANALIFLQGGPSFKALLSGGIHWGNILGVALFFGVWLIIALVFAYSLYFRRRLIDRRVVLLFCLAWFGLITLFNFYWAPEDIQFWFGLIPPLLVVLSLAHRDLVKALQPREELLDGLFVFGFALIFVVNLLTVAIPRASMQANAGLNKTFCLEHVTGPKDLIVTPGWDWASSYVPYFTGRNLFSVVDTYVLSAGGDRAKLFQLMDERIAETRANGGQVYAVRLFNLNQDEAAWFKQATGLTADDFPYQRKQAGDCGGEVVWEIVKQ